MPLPQPLPKREGSKIAFEDVKRNKLIESEVLKLIISPLYWRGGGGEAL